MPSIILFNNAGTGTGEDFPNEEDEGWERVVGVNLSGTFYMSRAVWPHMVGAGGGAIVNNSSIAAVIGFSKNLYDPTDRAPSSSYYVSPKRESTLLHDTQPVWGSSMTSGSTV